MYFFFFNDTATTEIYTLSLHDALPISAAQQRRSKRVRTVDFTRPTKFTSDQERRFRRTLDAFCRTAAQRLSAELRAPLEDRKSTRLNSSHANISYAVFCLKKKYSHFIY